MCNSITRVQSRTEEIQLLGTQQSSLDSALQLLVEDKQQVRTGTHVPRMQQPWCQ